MKANATGQLGRREVAGTLPNLNMVHEVSSSRSSKRSESHLCMKGRSKLSGTKAKFNEIIRRAERDR